MMSQQLFHSVLSTRARTVMARFMFMPLSPALTEDIIAAVTKDHLEYADKIEREGEDHWANLIREVERAGGIRNSILEILKAKGNMP